MLPLQRFNRIDEENLPLVVPHRSLIQRHPVLETRENGENSEMAVGCTLATLVGIARITNRTDNAALGYKCSNMRIQLLEMGVIVDASMGTQYRQAVATGCSSISA